MKKFAVLAVAALVSASAFAAADWVGDSYIIINGKWYNGSGQGNPAFDDISVWGDSFTLSATIDIHDADGADWGGGSWEKSFHYAWDLTPGQEENWTDVTMNYIGKSDFNQNNMRAQAVDSVIDISGWQDGESHEIAIYFGPIDNQYDSGNNFTATITKTIPEPATMSLLGLGALAMVIRRKLSK